MEVDFRATKVQDLAVFLVQIRRITAELMLY